MSNGDTADRRRTDGEGDDDDEDEEEEEEEEEGEEESVRQRGVDWSVLRVSRERK